MSYTELARVRCELIHFRYERVQVAGELTGNELNWFRFTLNQFRFEVN